MINPDDPGTMVRKFASSLQEDAVALKTKADMANDGLMLGHAAMAAGPDKPTRKELSLFLEGNATMAAVISDRLLVLARLLDEEMRV